MTYPERVRKVSINLSIEHITPSRWHNTSEEQQEWTIDSMSGKAAIAITEAEQGIREYLNKSWGHHAPNPDKFLIENGYLPDPELNNDPSGPNAMGPGH